MAITVAASIAGHDGEGAGSYFAWKCSR